VRSARVRRGYRAIGLSVVTALTCACAVLWWLSLTVPGGVVWTSFGVSWQSMRSPRRPTALWLADNVSLSVRNHALFFVSNHTPRVRLAERAPVTNWRTLELLGFEFSRSFQDDQPAPYLWLIRVPLSIVTVLLAIWPATALVGFWRRRRRARQGHCAHCGYDLTGNVTGICSECGARTGSAGPPPLR